MLSDVVLDFCGATIMEKQRREWNLPAFPNLNSDSGSVLIQASPTDGALKWLQAARTRLLEAYHRLNKGKKDDPQSLRKLRQCERLGLKVRATIEALKNNAADWYILSGPRARKVMGVHKPAFVCKPLTARHHAPRFFLDGWRTTSY